MNFKTYINLIKRSLFNTAYLNETMPDLEKRFCHHIDTQLAKQRLEDYTFHSDESGVSENLYNGEQLIVSLTTHGKRIDTVYHTVESMFQQTLKPNRVVLCLGDREYTSVDQLPIPLRLQVKRGLEVMFVKDVRSYTKLLPTLCKYPQANIVTIDDDFIYPSNLLEKLWNAHLRNPEMIVCKVAREMKLSGQKQFSQFTTFESKDYDKDYVSKFNLLEGFAGVLYPVGAFDNEVFNSEIFLKLAPAADDVWFTAMAIKNGTSIVQIPRPFGVYHEMYQEDEVQDISLAQSNIGENRNDIQLKAVFDKYDLWQKLQ